jgi:hypothetical protein
MTPQGHRLSIQRDQGARHALASGRMKNCRDLGSLRASERDFLSWGAIRRSQAGESQQEGPLAFGEPRRG